MKMVLSIVSLLLVFIVAFSEGKAENSDGYLTKEEMATMAYPPLHCHPPLCDLRQGYFVEEENVTRIYVEYQIGEEICAFVRGHSDFYCIISDTIAQNKFGWIDLPVRLSGVEEMTIYRTPFTDKNSQSTLAFKAYVHEVPSFPKTSWYWSEIIYPTYGAVIDSGRLLLKLVHGKALFDERKSFVIRIKQVRDIVYQPTFDILDSRSIEPGSYFADVGVFEDIDNPQAIFSSGYFEHVLSPTEIVQNRRFFLPSSSAVKSEMQVSERFDSAPKKICIWTSDNMDGQKNIWLQQFNSLSRKKYEFICLLAITRPSEAVHNPTDIIIDGETVSVSKDGFVLKLLKRKLAKVTLNPAPLMPIEIDSLYEVPVDGSPPFAPRWEPTEHDIMAYLLERLDTYSGNEESITPIWARNYILTMISFLKQQACDLMIYGNDRDSSSDALIPALGEVMGIPTVSELLNLFVATIPSVIIAPSHFAAEHPTVSHANSTDTYRGTGKPKKSSITVISPGIDLQRFDPDKYRLGTLPIKQYHSTRRYSEEATLMRPFVIGFVGRLSIEKNVGLFLLAAERILLTCPHCRFTVVGDGELRHKLELLCLQLKISWAVHFAGWQDEDSLPGILAGMDVVVNPSLRAWSETFCIANAEAMAMETPLITFAIGGVGEYVREPQPWFTIRSDASASFVGSQDEMNEGMLSIGPNAIILNVALPEAIEKAVLLLVRRPELAKRLARSARSTIQEHFSIDRQTRAYDDLYQQLLYP